MIISRYVVDVVAEFCAVFVWLTAAGSWQKPISQVTFAAFLFFGSVLILQKTVFYTSDGRVCACLLICGWAVFPLRHGAYIHTLIYLYIRVCVYVCVFCLAPQVIIGAQLSQGGRVSHQRLAENRGSMPLL